MYNMVKLSCCDSDINYANHVSTVVSFKALPVILSWGQPVACVQLKMFIMEISWLSKNANKPLASAFYKNLYTNHCTDYKRINKKKQKKQESPQNNLEIYQHEAWNGQKFCVVRSLRSVFPNSHTLKFLNFSLNFFIFIKKNQIIKIHYFFA